MINILLDVPNIENTDFYCELKNYIKPNESIKRVISERKKTVYATDFKFSAILVDNGNIKLIGNVKTFKN